MYNISTEDRAFTVLSRLDASGSLPVNEKDAFRDVE